jgi:MFS transporter, UMF1 family
MNSPQAIAHTPKNDPKLIHAWCSFDWANSVYNLTITTAVFPIYYLATTEHAFGGKTVPFLGMSINNNVLLSYAVGLSFVFAALLSPLLSGVADYSGKKKSFMRFFTYLGASSCLALYGFTGENLLYGIFFYVLASIGYSGAIVFYLSYLPEIASDDKVDDVSARGFAYGYIGSAIQLIISLVITLKHEWFGIPDAALATRISFAIVGFWWLGFAQLAFWKLPEHPIKRAGGSSQWLSKGIEELRKVWRQLPELPQLRLFLLLYFFFNMGAQTVFLLAGAYGSDVLHIPTPNLIGTILALQIVGVLGAYIFSTISKYRGNRLALLLVSVLWSVICLLGFLVVDGEREFYVMAVAVGVAMGGTALGRSTYAKLLPENTSDTTSFYSFYDLTEKVATALGPFIYGTIGLLTGHLRYSLLALTLFFVVSGVLLMRLRIRRN